MPKSVLYLLGLLAVSSVAASEFWKGCGESRSLQSSLASCNVSEGPGDELVYSPDYIWRSPSKYARRHSQSSGVEFMLIGQVHVGSKLFLPPRFPADQAGEFRQFLHDGLTMNISEVAQAMPSWKYQAEYVTSFCSPEHISCVSTKQEALDHAKLLLKSFSRVLYASPVEDHVLEMKKVIPVIHKEDAVACHDVYFTFQMLACHYLRNFTLFSVETSDGGQQYVACHGDTSIWPPEHPAYKYLNVSYPTDGICHAENEKFVFFA